LTLRADSVETDPGHLNRLTRRSADPEVGRLPFGTPRVRSCTRGPVGTGPVTRMVRLLTDCSVLGRSSIKRSTADKCGGFERGRADKSRNPPAFDLVRQRAWRLFEILKRSNIAVRHPDACAKRPSRPPPSGDAKPRPISARAICSARRTDRPTPRHEPRVGRDTGIGRWSIGLRSLTA